MPRDFPVRPLLPKRPFCAGKHCYLKAALGTTMVGTHSYETQSRRKGDLSNQGESQASLSSELLRIEVGRLQIQGQPERLKTCPK